MSRRIRIFVLANGVVLDLLGVWGINEVQNNAYLQTWLTDHGLLQIFASGLGGVIGFGLTTIAVSIFKKSAFLVFKSITWQHPQFDPSEAKTVSVPASSVPTSPADTTPMNNLVVPNNNLPGENLSKFIQSTNEQYQRVEIDYGPSLLSKMSKRAQRRPAVSEPDRQGSDNSGS